MDAEQERRDEEAPLRDAGPVWPAPQAAEGRGDEGEQQAPLAADGRPGS